MKNALIPLALAVAGCAAPKFTATTAANTDYILDGAKLSDAPVVQNTLAMTSGDLTVTGFQNYSTGQRTDELSAFADYRFEISERVVATLGASHLTFPNIHVPQSNRASVALTLDDKLTLKLQQDLDNNSGIPRGQLLTLGYTQPFTAFSQDFKADVVSGYNHRFYADTSEFSHIDFGISTGIPLTETLTLIPSVRYMHTFRDREISEAYGGMTLELKF